jgi:hypothetical protein
MTVSTDENCCCTWVMCWRQSVVWPMRASPQHPLLNSRTARMAVASARVYVMKLALLATVLGYDAAGSARGRYSPPSISKKTYARPDTVRTTEANGSRGKSDLSGGW